MTTKPFQAASGAGIGLPGPSGRFGRGPSKTALQQAQDRPSDNPPGTTQPDASESPKQAH